MAFLARPIHSLQYSPSPSRSDRPLRPSCHGLCSVFVFPYCGGLQAPRRLESLPLCQVLLLATVGYRLRRHHHRVWKTSRADWLAVEDARVCVDGILGDASGTLVDRIHGRGVIRRTRPLSTIQHHQRCHARTVVVLIWGDCQVLILA